MFFYMYALLIESEMILNMDLYNNGLCFIGFSCLGFKSNIERTLTYRIDEQDLISEQGGKFRKINKRAGLNKRAGWKISKKLIKEQD